MIFPWPKGLFQDKSLGGARVCPKKLSQATLSSPEPVLLGLPPTSISLYHLGRRPSSHPCPSCAISCLGTSSARADMGAAMADQVLELLSPELEPLLTWMMVTATLCRSPREKGSKQCRPGEDLLLFQFCRSSDQGPEHRAVAPSKGETQPYHHSDRLAL